MIVKVVLKADRTTAGCRCSNAETQIFSALADLNLNSGSFNATALAGYYILGEGGSLNNVSEAAAGVNFAAIKTTINNTIQQTITVSRRGDGMLILLNFDHACGIVIILPTPWVREAA